MTKLNGLVLINKEAGMTSHDVVFSLRKIIKDKQVGHIGTLDPMAEGLLVCLVGESVKLSDYLMGSDKKYRLTLKLGVETDTWDITGNVLKTVDKDVSTESIREAILNLSGQQSLPIPMYSAKKVDGKKLYEVARKTSAHLSEAKITDAVDNDSFAGPEKEMNFWDIQITEINFPYVSVEFQVSKGTFVRSWVYCLGRQLGVGAAMTKLERLSIGEYQLTNATTLERLRSIADMALIPNEPFFLNPWQSLQNRTILELDEIERDKLKTGLVSYALSNRIQGLGLKGFVFCFHRTHLIGILAISEVIEVKRIFVNSAF